MRLFPVMIIHIYPVYQQRKLKLTEILFCETFLCFFMNSNRFAKLNKSEYNHPHGILKILIYICGSHSIIAPVKSVKIKTVEIIHLVKKSLVMYEIKFVSIIFLLGRFYFSIKNFKQLILKKKLLCFRKMSDQEIDMVEVEID